VLGAFCLLNIAHLESQSAGSQGADDGIWSGIYTAAQAERGKAAFELNCARCHGADLSGSTAPALRGEAFITNWEGDTLKGLFTKVGQTMPPDNPSRVDTGSKLDIVAYLLQANGFPAGNPVVPILAAETDAGVRLRRLEEVQILRRGQDGRDIADFSLVRVVGCLTETSGAWILAKSTAPARARADASHTAGPAELQAIPLGDQTFGLVNVVQFAPERHRNHKVEASGLLRRSPDEQVLRLVSLQASSPAGECE
jgi:hypothetical protein